MKKRYAKQFSVLATLSLLFVTMQNCQGQKVGFNTAVGFGVVEPFHYPDGKALVYGGDPEDRAFLAARIAGNQAPGLQEIFARWRIIAGQSVYASAADIQVDPTTAYCQTSLDAKGEWVAGVLPTTGKAFAPGSYSVCIEQPWFAAKSWSYVADTKRLHNAVNSGFFNGFISPTKFERYVSDAVVTSIRPDDDSIGLIIAAVIDANGDVHTLTATRTQGGNAPALGWGLVHRMNNKLVKVIGNSDVGGINKNKGTNTPPIGDGLGWNSRATRIHVERNGDKIVATTSLWGSVDGDLPTEATSAISIDLADAALGLGIFKGAQFHGYGTQSEQSAEFVKTSFTTTTDAEYLYDLEMNLVYKQQPDGTYQVVPGADAYLSLGVPSIYGNPETQKEYTLDGPLQYHLNI